MLSLLKRILEKPLIFDLGARFYAWFNQNPIWLESCARLAEYFPPPRQGQPLRVVDLGCGPGVTAIALAQARPDAILIGIDIAPRMLDIARQRTRDARLWGQISYVLADARALPFLPESVDVVTGHSFLYLVPDRAGVLRAAFNALCHGGRYISMEPRDGIVERGFVRRHWRDIRFLTSIALWRPFSKLQGRFDENSFPATLRRAGFKNTATDRVIGGYGIIGYGEK